MMPRAWLAGTLLLIARGARAAADSVFPRLPVRQWVLSVDARA
jgi:hypothetical protein